MLMLCWFYCIPFAKFLYFALSPILLVFSLFVLKRGVRTGRLGLRQWAFMLMFFSVFKLCIFDIRLGGQYLFCDLGVTLPMMGCSAKGVRIAEFFCLVLLLASSLVIFHFYRLYLPVRKPNPKTPEEVNLRLWANISMMSVMAMVVWTMAPWVGYLTIGRLPEIFKVVQWQHFAIVNLLLLLFGFWKSESCSWEKNVKVSARSRHTIKTWTPRDTLWLNVFLYLITLALSYVAHDVLTGHMPKG